MWLTTHNRKPINMGSNQYFLFFIGCLLIALTSCNKDEDLTLLPDSTGELAYNGPAPNTTIIGQFAEQLGKAMTYPEVRSFVKEKVMLQYDKDYDFLVAFEASAKLKISSRPDVATFRDLFYFLDTDQLPGQKNSQDFIDALLDAEPLLQVHIPELWEGSTANWDELNSIPKIACLSLVTNDKGDLPTYDSNLDKWETISGTKVPEEVTVVVSRSERTLHSKGKYTSKTNKGKTANKSNCLVKPIRVIEDDYYYDALDIEHYNNCNSLSDGENNGGNNPVGNTEAKSFPCSQSDRDLNSNDDQVSFRRFVDINRWRDANEWFDGEHEIRVHITFRNSGGGPTTLKKSWFASSDDLRTCRWFSCDVDNFNGAFKDVKHWLPEVQGDIMNYTWEEVDSGQEYNLGIKFKPTIKIGPVEVSLQEVSASTKISNKSDRLGEVLVEYCDETTPPSSYDTDWIIFQVRQVLN